jgi:hypothetical protein
LLIYGVLIGDDGEPKLNNMTQDYADILILCVFIDTVGYIPR